MKWFMYVFYHTGLYTWSQCKHANKDAHEYTKLESESMCVHT